LIPEPRLILQTAKSESEVAQNYRALDTLVNVLVSLTPRPFTTAMIATEMPAAIRPYSIAVAPELSFKKLLTSFFILDASIVTV
jgi:hypothetical protein